MKVLLVAVLLPACVWGVYNETAALVPGDIYITGLLDVHGPGTNADSCGTIRETAGYLLMETFLYALQKVNSKTGVFKDLGVTIGGIGLDTCRSGSRITQRLRDLESGELRFPGVDMSRMVGVVGPGSSGMSAPVQDFLKQHKVTQVSFSASSTKFADTGMYPYFLTAIPLDDRQASGMAELLASLQLTSIQTVAVNDDYGINGIKALKTASNTEGVCVTHSYILGPDGTAEEIMAKLVDNMESSPVVVAFLHRGEAVDFMLAKAANDDAKDMVIVGTEAWADDRSVINGVESSSNGLITMKVKADQIPGFDDYMTPKRYSMDPNPWFDEYFEKVKQCSSSTCSKTESVTTAATYAQDTYATPLVNSVYAMALGIHAALVDICGPGYTSVCDEFLTAVEADNRNKIWDATQKVTFTDITGVEFKFVGNNGNQGYEILRYDQEQDTYNRVGTYSDKLMFASQTARDLVETYYPDVDSTCSHGNTITPAVTIATMLILALIKLVMEV